MRRVGRVGFGLGSVWGEGGRASFWVCELASAFRLGVVNFEWRVPNRTRRKMPAVDAVDEMDAVDAQDKPDEREITGFRTRSRVTLAVC